MTQDSDEYDGPLGVLQVLAYGRKLLLKTYKEKKTIVNKYRFILTWDLEFQIPVQ